MSLEEEAVVRLVLKLEALGIPYMVAGSIAGSHHGVPRATNDADIVVDPAPEALEALLETLLAEDTILAKLEWARRGGGSERQLGDALGVLQVGGDRIDRSYVEGWAAALGVEDLWRMLLGRLAP